MPVGMRFIISKIIFWWFFSKGKEKMTYYEQSGYMYILGCVPCCGNSFFSLRGGHFSRFFWWIFWLFCGAPWSTQSSGTRGGVSFYDFLMEMHSIEWHSRGWKKAKTNRTREGANTILNSIENDVGNNPPECHFLGKRATRKALCRI